MNIESGPLMEALVAWRGGGATARIAATLILLGASVAILVLLWMVLKALLRRLDATIETTKGRWIRTVHIQKQRIMSELHAYIQDCFHAAGVEILSPHYRANRDGNAVAIPGAGGGRRRGSADE